MIKYKTRYRFNFSNLSILIRESIETFLGYFFLITFQFIAIVLLPVETACFIIIPIQVYFAIALVIFLNKYRKGNYLKIFEKLITEYEYKEKLIPYSKFEKKYKKTQKQQA
jgi:hypothetical protein